MFIGQRWHAHKLDVFHFWKDFFANIRGTKRTKLLTLGWRFSGRHLNLSFSMSSDWTSEISKFRAKFLKVTVHWMLEESYFSGVHIKVIKTVLNLLSQIRNDILCIFKWKCLIFAFEPFTMWKMSETVLRNLELEKHKFLSQRLHLDAHITDMLISLCCLVLIPFMRLVKSARKSSFHTHWRSESADSGRFFV